MPYLAYGMEGIAVPKRVVWMGETLDVIRGFPEGVREEMGYALYVAQVGQKHPNAKPLRGFGAGVFEVTSDHHKNAYRIVYTLRLKGRICVLHVFQKKSRKGIATPKGDLDLIKRRLKQAFMLYGSK